MLQGDPGSGARQGAPGIIVNTPADRHVVIRNIVSRNWTIGIDVRGDSHVFVDNCRIENNANWGIRVQDRGRVKINDTKVAGTGFRVGGGADFPRVNPPTPGIGIEFEGSSSGLICNSCVTRSFSAGIKSNSGSRGRGNANVRLQNVCAFDNNPDLQGVRE